MQSLVQKIESKYRKAAVIDVRSGDTVRVHQKVVEGNKTRTQVFEGLVIRTDRKNSLSSSITVRRIASGVGVEKTYLLHSPNIIKIEVTKRSKVRRNYLSYMRSRTGKSARLTGVEFDRAAVNALPEPEVPADEVEDVAPQSSENSEAPSNDDQQPSEADDPRAEDTSSPDAKAASKEDK